MATESLQDWCCRGCGRPAIDHDPYALDRKITPFVTIGGLMRGTPLPPIWRPIARWRWLRHLEVRALRALKAQCTFETRIGALR